MKKQLKSILKTKVRNWKVKFINDTKDVVVFFDEELYKLNEPEWISRLVVTHITAAEYGIYQTNILE